MKHAKHAKQAKDPVCGMMVDIDKDAFHSAYEGQDYYFCASECKTTFDANPAKYVAAEPAGEMHTKKWGMHAPKFGSAGSGGAEYERGPSGKTKTKAG